MATERIRTIKPSGQGGDYTSLSAWEAAEQADLVALDEIRIGQIEGDWSGGPDTTAVTIDGWTTDATRYIKILTTGTAKHQGKWDTTKYRLSVANASAIRFIEPHCRVHNLQIEITAVNASDQDTILVQGVPDSTNPLILVEGCLLKGINSANSWHVGVQTWSNFMSSVVVIANCIAYGFKGTGTNGAYLTASQGKVTLLNCTAYDCASGFYAVSSEITAKNCLSQNCPNGFDAGSGGFHASSTNNCSNLTDDALGSNPQTGTVQFIDAANGDFHLSPSDTVARGKGANLSNNPTYSFNNDIDGQTRGSVWDIGADQVSFGSPKLFSLKKITGLRSIRV